MNRQVVQKEGIGIIGQVVQWLIERGRSIAVPRMGEQVAERYVAAFCDPATLRGEYALCEQCLAGFDQCGRVAGRLDFLDASGIVGMYEANSERLKCHGDIGEMEKG